MHLLVLFETPFGFALFGVLDERKLSNHKVLADAFSTAESARRMVKLKAFYKFRSTCKAVEEVAKLLQHAPSDGLCEFLRSNCERGSILGVAETKLGSVIREKLGINCGYNNTVFELLRGIRSQLTGLIPALRKSLPTMRLGLSHSFARHTLTSRSDKETTVIIPSIGLLDDLDKKLDTLAMRLREFYGWHFPELAKIVEDKILYAKAVKLMGDRIDAAKLDFSEILAEEVEAELKEAAVISVGADISVLDFEIIRDLCDQFLSLAEYRATLYDNLKSSMHTVAPNLTGLVGVKIGARLISRGGGLLKLSKQPGSLVQILGAEKSLFRALKTRVHQTNTNHRTPKHGLIYQAFMHVKPKHKGKISRSLAAKAALAIRCDALGDGQGNAMGVGNRFQVEARLRKLEARDLYYNR